MKQYTINQDQFLEWYFEGGQDSENESIREDLAEKLIHSLAHNGFFTITAKDVFDECNKDAIKLCYINEFDNEDERELEDLNEDYELTLIENEREVSRWVGVQIEEDPNPRVLIGLDGCGEIISAEWKDRYEGNRMDWTSERIKTASKPSSERVFNDLDNIIDG